MAIQRIVTGGQTGVDRAALDAVPELHVPSGGWVPKGRLDEQGVIPPHYPNLIEADSPDPNVRTELNVRDSDATLILSHGELFGGTKYTAQKTTELRKPLLHINLNKMSNDDAVEKVIAWLDQSQPEVLNVAGPRHGEDNTIYSLAKSILTRVLLHQGGAKPLKGPSQKSNDDTGIANK